MKIAFDIDNTLMKFDRERKIQVPDYHLISVLHWFVANGDDVIIWSGGGKDYVDRTIEKLGLHNVRNVTPKGSEKVDIAFDDETAEIANINILVRRFEHDTLNK